VDYRLPDANGLDLVRELRSRDEDAPIVVITAFASLDVAVTATKNGAFDFLSKPFTPEELEAVVRKAVRQLTLQRRARALEEQRRRARFEFLSVLAHELKAPLGAVENYLRIMKDQVLGPYVSNYETQIDRALLRIEGMRKMISDLLDLTRIESGEKRRELQRLDLGEVARQVLDNYAAEASARGIALELHAPAPVELQADRGEMEIILNNLVSNAIKYNRPKGRVDVYVMKDGEQVTIRVRDTGIGISEADAAKLFHEFVRIKNEHTAAIPGSGLGLSIVKKLALLYDGDVSVRGQPGEGSEFTVTLKATSGGRDPAKEESHPQDANPPSAAATR
jgi:signal transduction histidine kinase